MDIMQIYEDKAQTAALFIDKIADVALYRDYLIFCIRPKYNGTPLYDSKGVRTKSVDFIRYDTKTDSLCIRIKSGDSVFIPYKDLLINETLQINGCEV